MKLIFFFLFLWTLSAEAGGRRVRHLNARHAGAVLVLDARFVTGLADGNAVSTWSDLSGNGNHVSQALATWRPTFEVNELAGNPIIRFDGVNDIMSSAAPAQTNTDNWTMLSVALTKNGLRVHFSNGANTGYAQTHKGQGTGFGHLFGGVAWLGDSTPRFNRWIIQSSVRTAGTLVVFDQGTAFGTTWTTNPNTPTTSTSVGGDGFAVQEVDVALAILMPVATSQSIRRRLEHAAAFSFKIPCN